jgi:hypothetical protein
MENGSTKRLVRSFYRDFLPDQRFAAPQTRGVAVPSCERRCVDAIRRAEDALRGWRRGGSGAPMSNFPFEDTISRVGKADLEELLRSFEDTWAKTTGSRLTSPEFYDLYRRGEMDSMFAASWATYYESWRALTRREADTRVADLPGALLAS